MMATATSTIPLRVGHSFRGGDGRDEAQGTDDIDDWVSLNAHVARLTHTTAVAHVDISHVVFATSEWQWLCLVLGQATSLRFLTLDGNGLTDAHVATLLVEQHSGGQPGQRLGGHGPQRRHGHLASLEALSLAHNRMTYRSMAALYKFVLWRTEHLVSLNVSENPLGDHGAHVLCIGLAKQNVDEMASGGSAAMSLFPQGLYPRRPQPRNAHVRNPGGLASLQMRNCRLSLRGIKDVLFAANCMSWLTHLDLGENDAVRSLCEGRQAHPLTSFPELPRHSNLQSLLLPSCSVGSQVTPAAAHELLLALLLSCDRLGEIVLDHAHDDLEQPSLTHGGGMGWGATRVADVLAELLFQVAEDSLQRSRAFPAALSSLHTVSLEGSGLSDDGAKAFAYAVWNRPSDAFLAHLVRLNVRRNYLSVDGVLDVLEVMVHLAECRTQRSGGQKQLPTDAADAQGNHRFLFFAEENAMLASMRDVDALYEAAVEMLYRCDGGSGVVAAKVAAQGLFTFGPCNPTSDKGSSLHSIVAGYTCQAYCEVVRRQPWPYRRQDAFSHHPSSAAAPSPSATRQRNNRPSQHHEAASNTLLHTSADISAIPKAPPTSFYDEGTSPIRHPFLDQHAGSASPTHRHQQRADASSTTWMAGSRSPTASPHRPPVPSPQHTNNEASIVSMRGNFYDAHNPTNTAHHDDHHLPVHRRGPLVSPPRDDDTIPAAGGGHGEDRGDTKYAHQRQQAAYGQGPLHPVLDIYEEHDVGIGGLMTAPVVDDQAASLSAEAVDSLRIEAVDDGDDNASLQEAAVHHYMAKRQSPIRRQAALDEQESKYLDPHPTTAEQHPAGDPDAAPTTDGHNNSSVLVITAADKAAARKARLAANRARRRKLLGAGDGDEEQQQQPEPDILDAVPSSSAPDGAPPPSPTPPCPPTDNTMTIDDDAGAVLQDDHDAPPNATSLPSSMEEQRTAASPPSDSVATVGGPLRRLPPLVLPKPMERDPSGLKGRVKTFTLTYTHPPGHIICRMWHLLVGSDTCGGAHADAATRQWLQDAATAALTQDLFDRLQPDTDDTAHCVDVVTLATNPDALSVDVTVVTNEKRTTVAQRLQDAAALGDTAVAPAAAERDFLAGGSLPADGSADAPILGAFPRCCRLLHGFTEAGVPLVNPHNSALEGLPCTMVLDLVAHAATCLAPCAAAATRAGRHHDHVPAALEGYQSVHEWVHLMHAREDELLAALPAAASSPLSAGGVSLGQPVETAPSPRSHDAGDVISQAATEIFSEANNNATSTSPLVATPVGERSPLEHRFNEVATDDELRDAGAHNDQPQEEPTASSPSHHESQAPGGDSSLTPNDRDATNQPQTSATKAAATEGTTAGGAHTPLDDESKDATARGLALMPSDLPWALPASTGDGVIGRSLPDTYVRWSGDLRLCPATAPSDDPAEAFERLLQRLHGHGTPHPGEVASRQLHQRREGTPSPPSSRPATPPPPAGPASPHRLVAAASAAAPSPTFHSTAISDDDDEANAVGPNESIGDVVQRRAATEPRLSFLKRTTPRNDNGDSPFRRSSTATPTHQTATPMGVDADDSAMFHTQWRQEAEALLHRARSNRRPHDPPPSVSVALVERRLKNIARVCTTAVAAGAVALSTSVRNKVRVCQGTIDPIAFTSLLASLAEVHRDADHLQHAPAHNKPVRVTLSVEWDGLLVLKQDDGGFGGHGKRLLHVHPLAHGVDASAGGEGADVGKGKEIILQLQRPGLTETEEQAVARHVSNAALRGKVSLSPSAPAAALARAVAHRVTLCIRLDSAKNVSKATLRLNDCVEKAVRMVLTPSATGGDPGSEGDPPPTTR